MKINYFWSWEVPDEPVDVYVIIDVYAATSNIPVMLFMKPKNLFVINEDSLINIKNKYPNSLLVGESDELPKEMFAAKNLPYNIGKLKLKNKTILYMSNNGSRVIEKVIRVHPQFVVTASFNNLFAVSTWITNHNFSLINIISSGEKSFPDYEANEDFYCAQALGRLLKKDKSKISYYLKKAKDFVKSAYSPPVPLKENYSLIFTLNRFSLVPICYFEKEGYISIKQVSPERLERSTNSLRGNCSTS